NVLYGDVGNDTLSGGTTSASLNGGDGNDQLTAGSAGGVVNGDGDNDTLIGGLGDDYLDGGDGNDSLYGGPGTDVLTGGNGADIFSFRAYEGKVVDASHSYTITDFDTVTDFTPGADKISVGFAGTATNTFIIQAPTFGYDDALSQAMTKMSNMNYDIVVVRVADGLDKGTYVFVDSVQSEKIDLAIKLAGAPALGFNDFV
ncbi:MAG: hypothetical protein CGW95_16980, partial [Phenylobacterium zucineum]